MATTQETRTEEQTRVDEKVDGAHPIDVRTERGTTADPYAGIAVAHDRFGGIDIPASLVGMLTALSTALILAGLLGAVVGAVDYETGLESSATEIAVGTVIAGVAVVFAAFLVGGWAAGRMARYDGARNGFAAGIWTLILAGILTGPGWISGDYDVFRNVDLPQWFSTEDFTTRAIIGGLAAVVAMFVGGIIGGYFGERYHRRADRMIAAAPVQR
jgi:hypothetical protein